MIHYTLNTGHSLSSPRSEVADEIILALRPLCVTGEHPLPHMDGYSIDVRRGDSWLTVGIYGPEDRPLAVMAVAADELATLGVWPALEQEYYAITDMPGLRAADFKAAHRPETTPWLAVILMMVRPDEALWLGDLERCLAWTFLDSLEQP